MKTTLTGPYGRAHITEARSGDYYVHCQDGINCHGPGCRIDTGKTTRKKSK